MATRTFTSDFTYEIDSSTTRTIPAGWFGELDDDVAAQADEAGATDKPAKKGKSAPKTAQADEAGATDASDDQAPA